MSYGGFIGSPSIETSEKDKEIVPKGMPFHKFSFMNWSNCTVSINGSAPIFLAEGQGFNSDKMDAPIKSFIILESGVNHNWLGAYRNVSI